MNDDDRLTLLSVDLATENADRIGRIARAEVGREPPRAEVYYQRFLPAGAVAFGAYYLVWAAERAHVFFR